MPTLLCIDDLGTALAVRKLMLETKGYAVLTATDGQTGLDLMASNKIDAVILDYSMPDMDGEEVARAIKSRWPSIGIILLSGYPEVPESAQAVSDTFVVKGAPPEELFSAIERLTGPPPTPNVTPAVERSRELMQQATGTLERTRNLIREDEKKRK